MRVGTIIIFISPFCCLVVDFFFLDLSFVSPDYFFFPSQKWMLRRAKLRYISLSGTDTKNALRTAIPLTEMQNNLLEMFHLCMKQHGCC